MKRRDTADWEGLAQREPYFPLLATDGRFATEGCAESSPEFFATGEADVSALLAAVAALPGCELSLDSVLDFGCGAGRLTLPLARRAKQVIACDIAPTMLAHARENARRAGVTNVELILADELAALPSPSFDFICSLSVFQYISPSQGYASIRLLAGSLAAGGIAAIQMRFGSAGIRHLARVRSSGGQASAVRTYVYNERRVVDSLTAAGAQPVARLPVDQPELNDAVLIVRR